MNLYRTSLADVVTGTNQFSTTLSAGDKTYVCKFMWPQECQEQWDLLGAYLTRLSNTDPIGPESDRSYDWIDFYLQFQNMGDTEIQAFLLQLGKDIPNSFKGLSSYQLLVLIKERIQEALELQQVQLIYKEALRWQVSVECEGRTTIAVVQPGGWYNYDSGNAFRFIADARDYIGFDDLKYVSMEFDIDE